MPYFGYVCDNCAEDLAVGGTSLEPENVPVVSRCLVCGEFIADRDVLVETVENLGAEVARAERFRFDALAEIQEIREANEALIGDVERLNAKNARLAGEATLGFITFRPFGPASDPGDECEPDGDDCSCGMTDQWCRSHQACPQNYSDGVDAPEDCDPDEVGF